MPNTSSLKRTVAHMHTPPGRPKQLLIRRWIDIHKNTKQIRSCVIHLPLMVKWETRVRAVMQNFQSVTFLGNSNEPTSPTVQRCLFYEVLSPGVQLLNVPLQTSRIPFEVGRVFKTIALEKLNWTSTSEGWFSSYVSCLLDLIAFTSVPATIINQSLKITFSKAMMPKKKNNKQCSFDKIPFKLAKNEALTSETKCVSSDWSCFQDAQCPKATSDSGFIAESSNINYLMWG